MTDESGSAAAGTAAGAAAPTAGGLLRAAREKQGLHIAALATSIKVTPRRLEALEADRYDELLDLTFTRALAQTVCRALKIEPSPVLALLPQPGVAAAGLEHVSGGLNKPFRERPGRHEPDAWPWLRLPAFWATALLLVGAAVLFLAPPEGLRWPGTEDPGARPPAPAVGGVAQEAPAPQGEAATTPDVVPAPGADQTAENGAATSAGPTAPPVQAGAVPPPTAAAASAAVASVAGLPAGLIALKAEQASWVEVRDGAGQVLISRTLAAGETIGFDNPPPFRLKIGNAAGTLLRFRGQPVDLPALTRDNVARLELK